MNRTLEYAISLVEKSMNNKREEKEAYHDRLFFC